MSGDGHDATPTAGLLYDSLSRNTGDRAIGVALRQALAGIGVGAVDVPIHGPAGGDGEGAGEDGGEPLVIGGGELLRPSGDAFYDGFRRPGRHILNGVGVWPDADGLDHLAGYAFVSGRTRADAEVLRRWAPDVEIVPCMSTILRSDPAAEAAAAEALAAAGAVAGDGPLVGIHVVPHTMVRVPDLVEAIDAIEGRKVLVPFTHYNLDGSFMRSLGIRGAAVLDDLDPLVLHAVVGRLDLFVASSLHASIFAYAQGVPFVSVRQRKVEDYFGDRGLDHLLFGDRAELDAALEAALGGVDLAGPAAADRTVLDEVLQRWKPLLQEARQGPRGGDDPQWAAAVLRQQQEAVLLQRDALLGGVLARQHGRDEAARFELSQLRAELDAVRFHRARDRERVEQLEERLDDALAHLEAIERTFVMRVLRIPRAVYRRLRRLAGRGVVP
jgi:hypothetical protein